MSDGAKSTHRLEYSLSLNWVDIRPMDAPKRLGWLPVFEGTLQECRSVRAQSHGGRECMRRMNEGK